jgi:hypothetical protein
MIKRKGKGKRRKALAISTLGLGGVASQYETAPLYQSKFLESDMVWLADEYQRRSSSEPSLTLEDFSAQYGVSADALSSYVSDRSRDVSYSITLWHGTTASRAESILKEGFRAKKAKGRGLIFFTARPSIARGHAQSRASWDDPPAVFMCSIDLSHYSDYERRGRDVYVFRHSCIASEVIRKVEGLPRQRREKPEKQENPSVEVINVALTFDSGRAGIAYWINSYLRLNGDGRIHQDHEAVVKIKQWLDAQADVGRFGEVSDDEMLEQVRECLPQPLERI